MGKTRQVAHFVQARRQQKAIISHSYSLTFFLSGILKETRRTILKMYCPIVIGKSGGSAKRAMNEKLASHIGLNRDQGAPIVQGDQLVLIIH